MKSQLITAYNQLRRINDQFRAGREMGDIGELGRLHAEQQALLDLFGNIKDRFHGAVDEWLSRRRLELPGEIAGLSSKVGKLQSEIKDGILRSNRGHYPFIPCAVSGRYGADDRGLPRLSELRVRTLAHPSGRLPGLARSTSRFSSGRPECPPPPDLAMMPISDREELSS